MIIAKTHSAKSRLKPKLGNPSPEDVDCRMPALGIGIDTARYGHHVTFLRDDKLPACPPLSILESRIGYEQLQRQIERLQQRFPHARFYLRIDAAGQYSANLERFLRSLTHLPLSISVGEPKRNKDYHCAHSPKRQSDSTESHAMARYAVVERPDESRSKPPEFAALRRVASRLEAQTRHSTRLINQLHETLSASFPELASLIKDLAAGWVLLLLEKYPTAERIAAARLVSLQKIKYIPQEMPAQLHELAKGSVGALRGDIAEALITELVNELRHSLAEEKRWRDLLTKAFDALPEGPHRQLVTIQGIGKQTAAAIVATAIDVERFETDKQFVGYYGVFPMELQSGVDKLGRPIPPGKKIMCHKGNDLVRGLLWQCAKCPSAAKGGNPAVRALFQRRLKAGDTAQVAWGYCMTKLLRQIYGVWTSNTAFDAQYEAQPSVEDAPQEKPETLGPTGETLEEPPCDEVTKASASLEPVSSEPSTHSHCGPSDQSDQASRRPIDYRALREQVPLQCALERISRVPIQGVQHRGPCPIHEPKATSGRKFSANLKRQVFRCFDSACAAQGNVLDLWQAYTSLNVYEAALHLAQTFGVDVPYLPPPVAKQPGKKHKKNPGHHPPSP
jgi:transposase